MELNGLILLLLINQSIIIVNIISAPCLGSFQVRAGVDLKTLRLSFLWHVLGDKLRNASLVSGLRPTFENERQRDPDSLFRGQSGGF